MAGLRYCTLTGVDERTDVDALLKMGEAYPFAEFGVLYSSAKMAKDAGKGRYPREGWIAEFARQANDSNLSCALHICGEDGARFLRGDPQLVELAHRFGRVQLNVAAHGTQLAGLPAHTVGRAIHHFSVEEGGNRVILQFNRANAELLECLRTTAFLDVLIDHSGGRGVQPERWPAATELAGMRVGYAGGLGPNNIAAQLPLIEVASGGRPYWVDMESNLRHPNDSLDVVRCESVLREVAEHLVRKHLAHAEAVPVPGLGAAVSDLAPLELDWWAGLASGHLMNLPPKDYARATFLDRFDGQYRGFTPSEIPTDFAAVMRDSSAGARSSGGGWIGLYGKDAKIAGATREDALLRAHIAEAFGERLPATLADLPLFHALWAGETALPEALRAETAKAPALRM